MYIKQKIYCLYIDLNSFNTVATQQTTASYKINLLLNSIYSNLII
jgi:hypothetical protein